MATRNFETGIIGGAMRAFREGRIAEADKLIKEHEAITKTRFGIGDMALRGGELALRRQRFGVEKRVAESGLKSAEQQQTLTRALIDKNEKQARRIAELEAEANRQLEPTGESLIGLEAGVDISTKRKTKEVADVTTEFAKPREEKEQANIAAGTKLRLAQADEAKAGRQGKLSPIEIFKQTLRGYTTTDPVTGKTSAVFSPAQINNYAAERVLIEGDQITSPQELQQQLNQMTALAARIRSAATVEDAVNSATAKGEIDAQLAGKILSSFGNAGRPLTSTADRDAAINIILRRYNQIVLEARSRIVPIKSNLLTREDVGATSPPATTQAPPQEDAQSRIQRDAAIDAGVNTIIGN